MNLTDEEQIIYLLHELQEARLELERHHKDFEQIQHILDNAEKDFAPIYQGSPLAEQMVLALKQIRNIVG